MIQPQNQHEIRKGGRVRSEKLARSGGGHTTRINSWCETHRKKRGENASYALTGITTRENQEPGISEKQSAPDKERENQEKKWRGRTRYQPLPGVIRAKIAGGATVQKKCSKYIQLSNTGCRKNGACTGHT